MNRARYWIGALVVVGALAYLAFSGTDRNMVTYLTVSEVKANPAKVGDAGVRIVGLVADGSITARGAREVWFTVAGDADSLRACYRGVVPDTFKDGAEVVLEGRMEPEGHFRATTMLAKCPSKYEAELGGNAEYEGSQHPDEISKDS